MDNEVHSQLVTVLLETPGTYDYTVRTSLLVNIPNNHSLTRSQDPQADISLIISQLSAMYFSNGSWGLLIFIDRVLSRVLGTTLSDRLLEIRRLLEVEQIAKNKKQFSTPLPSSDELHEEAEKKEKQTKVAYKSKKDGLLLRTTGISSMPVEIFYSYSHKDEKLRKGLKLISAF